MSEIVGVVGCTVKYVVRKTLAQYEHEEIAIELTAGSEYGGSYEALLQEAQRIVRSNTAKAQQAKAELKKKREEQAKQNETNEKGITHNE
jgi:Flp pilus assembly protein TadB